MEEPRPDSSRFKQSTYLFNSCGLGWKERSSHKLGYDLGAGEKGSLVLENL